MSSTGNFVSVIVTANGGDPERTVRSALRQTHRHFEVILAADAQLADLAIATNDERVSLVPVRQGASPAEARNAALTCARGDILAYLSGNCAWYPYHLECLLEAMAESPERRAAVSRLYHVRCNGRVATEKKLPPSWMSVRDSLFASPCVEISALCHRRELLERTGTFDSELPSPACEWDLARRLAFYTDFASIEDITGELTVSSDNTEREETLARHADAVLAKHPPKPWSGLLDASVVFAPPQPDAPAEGLSLARRLEADGNWRQAARLYEQMMTTAEATTDLEHLAAAALYHLGDDQRAMGLCKSVNERRPSVDSLLLEARLRRRGDDDEAALEALQHAEQILSWKG
ncbi:MAG: glycosyltransferase [Phycisphaerae bacterium]